jgi:hypothetical protein
MNLARQTRQTLSLRTSVRSGSGSGFLADIGLARFGGTRARGIMGPRGPGRILTGAGHSMGARGSPSPPSALADGG